MKKRPPLKSEPLKLASMPLRHQETLVPIINSGLIFGTKVADNKRTLLIVDPPDGRLPALTAEGQKRAAARAEAMGRPANGPEDRALYDRIYEYACHVRLSLRVGNRGEVSGNAGFTVHDNRSGDQRMTVAGFRLAT
jgi:hypothetical protein